MRILVDVDCVVLDLMPVWLDRYNADYNDTLTVDRITEWNIEKFVKPECGMRIYKYLEQPDLYDNVRTIGGAWLTIKEFLQEKNEVIYVSAGFYPAPKIKCLQRNGLEVNESNFIATARKDCVFGAVLIDDNPKNINEFPYPGILYTQPWNVDVELWNNTWDCAAQDWLEVRKIVRCMHGYGR